MTRIRTALCMIAHLVPASLALAQVTVTGGRDKIQMNTYLWTLTNRGDKPITRFEFPRYNVEHLQAPQGWTGEIVRLGEDGRPLDPHRVVYQTGDSSFAIRPGESAVFTAIITTDKATPGQQTATIAFADGSTLAVSGVEIPWDYPWLEKHALLIGMGGLFAIFLLVQIIRGRRLKAQPSEVRS